MDNYKKPSCFNFVFSIIISMALITKSNMPGHRASHFKIICATFCGIFLCNKSMGWKHTQSLDHLSDQGYISIMVDRIKKNRFHKKIYTCQQWQSYIDDLVQDCSNSSALAMELLQFCTKPSIYNYFYTNCLHFISFWTWHKNTKDIITRLHTRYRIVTYWFACIASVGNPRTTANQHSLGHYLCIYEATSQ